ncbi:unnamed protein product (macronuclear) [Paramecium tetraurelia]|uniref:CRC domain-containing protein n=2 Tax=Paramecium TaxID=5884 RepID=A0BQI7_PARTE|nr:uncharacterized protein GSPATT00031033001 [Paramecium tetraurelia]CAD8202532.1 unnamed protein product [Paramecium octaurelia]CAK60804.1 unnamed protein product [Paramecium tetraurelia]|eukprot:XP_001428202.1 hypothetical protein (macronuclear) [Paramecium tetraurelia strain d4-2]
MKPNHCDTIFKDDQFQTPTRQQKRVITETTIKKPFQQKQRQCTCKKSQCLKMYCDCLAFGEYCGSECSCQNCHNDDKHPEQRSKVLEQMVEKNSSAQLKCNCRKSNCQKKYCECYNAGVKCSELCKCDDCKNSVKLGYNQFQIGNQKFILIPVQTFEQLKSQQK